MSGADDLRNSGVNPMYEAENIEALIAMCVGAGSTCWTNLGGAGEFDTTKALQVVADARERFDQLVVNAVAESMAEFNKELPS